MPHKKRLTLPCTVPVFWTEASFVVIRESSTDDINPHTKNTKGVMQNEKLIALLLAVVMVLGLAACATKTETPATDTPATDTPAASTETETKTETKEETPAEETDAEFNPADYTLVISMPVVNHPVHRCVQLGFVEACKELGYNYQIVGTETGDDNEVIAAAEAAAASGAAGIIIWGQNETYLPCIATLKNDYNVLTCVPHFAWDQDQAVGLDVNLACDAATYAVSVADYMAEQLEGKTGSIALTQAGYTTNEDAASAAFKAEIEKLQGEGKLAGITVLDPVIEGSADVTESTDVNASIIQANPDLIAAVSWTGNGPVTWSNAARKAGKAAGDLLIVSMDYTADNLVELESGYVSALVAQPLYQEAYQAVYDFDTLLRGGEVPYWTLLDAPLMYKGGEGEHDPAYYQDILDRVSTTFGN